MRRPTALLVTYTMSAPGAAVGVFFRALRLSAELSGRGWSCVVVNHGAVPLDPKVAQSRAFVEIRQFEGREPVSDRSRALAQFRAIGPDLVVFGEYPIPCMEPLFDASCALGAPPMVMLDQYYDPRSGALLRGVDRLIMYGLRSMWPTATLRHPALAVVPPFIDRVAPYDELPLPAAWRGVPLVTVLGLDSTVLRAGVAIVAGLRQHGIAAVTISRDPDTAAALLEAAGVPADRRLSLPLQHDAQLFGLIAASRAVVLANGFMQVIEAIALGCPVLCIHRGIGLDGHQVDAAFDGLVVFPPDTDAGVRQVASWIDAPPFTPSLQAALARERGGVARTADEIERTAARPRRLARLERHAVVWRRRFGRSTLLRNVSVADGA